MPYAVKEPWLTAARNTTIPEMIKWMEKLETKGYNVYKPEYHAIRMLLEEQRQEKERDRVCSMTDM